MDNHIIKSPIAIFKKPKKNNVLSNIMWKFLHQIGLHRLQFSHKNSLNIYCKCSICEKHFVITPIEGYQPIDYEWLKMNQTIK